MTSTEDDLRRLSILKRRPALSEKTDDYLLLCLEDARTFFLDYTNRDEDPGLKVDNLVCEIASLKANSEGAENVQQAADGGRGGISRTFYADIPPFLLNRLKNWRLMRGL